MTSSVLMLVRARESGAMPVPGVERRSDYRLVREALGAELLDLGAVERSLVGRLIQRIAGTYVALSVLAVQRVVHGGIDAVLCDNEDEALLLGVLLSAVRRRVPVVTLAIAPAARKKAVLFRLARAHRFVRLWLTLASEQRDYLTLHYGLSPKNVWLLPPHADTAYFDPASVYRLGSPRPTPMPYILAVGRQDRDYETLIQAAADLPLDVVIDAGSVYSDSPYAIEDRLLSPSVHVVSLNHEQLRAAYAFAEIVAVPTRENGIGAGGTSVLEGMAMARPVVVTRSKGSGDLLADRRAILRGPMARGTKGLFGPLFAEESDGSAGPHGLYVPPGDVAALRASLRYLLDHPQEAAEFGRRGRALVVDGLSTDHYVQRVVAAVSEVRVGSAHQKD